MNTKLGVLEGVASAAPLAVRGIRFAPPRSRAPHQDCPEHVVAYKVPAEKAGGLVKSHGSLSFNRTAGTLTARCDSEAHNVGSLNLAQEIIPAPAAQQQPRQEQPARVANVKTDYGVRTGHLSSLARER